MESAFPAGRSRGVTVAVEGFFAFPAARPEPAPALALAKALPPGAVTVVSKGCHSYPFFTAQEPLSLAFPGRHLTGQARPGRRPGCARGAGARRRLRR